MKEWIHKEVVITSDDVALTLNGHYHIEWERIDDPMKLIVWVLHLSEKTWIAPSDLNRLVETVCSHNGWRIPWGA